MTMVSGAPRLGFAKRIGALVLIAVTLSLLQLSAAPSRPRTIEPARPPIAFRDRLLPAPVDGGFRQDGYWVWCGTVVKGDDGLYHHYGSRWLRGLPFGPHWLTNSEVVHSVSKTPEGPYAFVDVALPPRGEQYWDGRMSHNPVVRRSGGKYYLYYTGTTYRGPAPTPESPTTEESALKLEAHRGERIGLAIADSPNGPWQRFDKPVLDVRPNSWEQYLVSNSSPLFMPDGSVLLYYKGVRELRDHAIGLARAKSPEGPYERVTDRPFDMGIGAEDPTMWFENGRYHALMLDTEKRYSDKEIYYATSPDGLKWEVQPNPVAVPKTYPWSDGVARRMGSTERPQILVQDGVATHLVFATSDRINGQRQTWSQVIPLKPESAVPDRLSWFRDARLGLFIHWGLYALPGGVWNGTPLRHDVYANPYCEHLMFLARVPLADYSALAARFNPKAWDARAIVAAAKAAGLKYVVFTAKHHDGFAMYASKVSKYNVVDATPWKRDPLRELAGACKEAGLGLGIYYSLGRDWENPYAYNASMHNSWDFPNATAKDSERYFNEKAVPQLTELLSNYGKVSLVWFDAPEQTTQKQSVALDMLVHRLQPEAIVNTRVGNGVGDIDEMGDNRLPARGTGRDFEVPVTMAESWGYSTLDTAPFWKSPTRLIRQMIDVASKNGNYLLNIGPDGQGAVPAAATERLSAIAKWMSLYGESIQGTRASSLGEPYWGRFTQRGDVLYAHVFEWPTTDFVLKVDGSFVRKIELLTPAGPTSVPFVPAQGAAVVLTLPKNAPDPHASVLRVTLR
jgi:alpha-L-fucosidase